MYNFDAQKTFAGLAVAEALMRPAQLPVLRDGHRGYHCTRCLLAFSFFLLITVVVFPLRRCFHHPIRPLLWVPLRVASIQLACACLAAQLYHMFSRSPRVLLRAYCRSPAGLTGRPAGRAGGPACSA